MNPTKRFYFDARTQEIIESITIPFAIYQYIDKRVVTIALSQGFCSEFGFKKLEDAYHAMDSDMYRATHPDPTLIYGCSFIIASGCLRAVCFLKSGGITNIRFKNCRLAGDLLLAEAVLFMHICVILNDIAVRTHFVFEMESAFVIKHESCTYQNDHRK